MTIEILVYVVAVLLILTITFRLLNCRQRKPASTPMPDYHNEEYKNQYIHLTPQVVNFDTLTVKKIINDPYHQYNTPEMEALIREYFVKEMAKNLNEYIDIYTEYNPIDAETVVMAQLRVARKGSHN